MIIQRAEESSQPDDNDLALDSAVMATTHSPGLVNSDRLQNEVTAGTLRGSLSQLRASVQSLQTFQTRGSKIVLPEAEKVREEE